jgi:CheY-like chemotaxis protein
MNRDWRPADIPRVRHRAPNTDQNRSGRDAPRPGSGRAAERPNTLGLDRGQLIPLLDRLDFALGPGERSLRRGFVRWPFRKETIELRFKHPGGTFAAIRVACRNLSRGGLSVLHSAFVHPGTECTAMVPHPALGVAPVDGRVVRCEHRSGVIHEIGMEFDEEIDVRQFIAHDPFSDFFCLEKVEPQALTGALVYIDDSAVDHKILHHMLRETRLRIRGAETAREGLAMIEEGCDLVVCDLHLSDGSGLDVVSAMRARGVRTPVILLTIDRSTAVRKAAEGLRVEAFIQKPPELSLLLRAMGEFLIVRRETPDEGTSDGPGAPEELVRLYLESLAACTTELEAAVRRNDQAAVGSVCQKIAGSGPSGAFASLRLLALEATHAIAAAESLRAAAGPLRALVRACKEATERRAP